MPSIAGALEELGRMGVPYVLVTILDEDGITPYQSGDSYVIKVKAGGPIGPGVDPQYFCGEMLARALEQVMEATSGNANHEGPSGP